MGSQDGPAREVIAVPSLSNVEYENKEYTEYGSQSGGHVLCNRFLILSRPKH